MGVRVRPAARIVLAAARMPYIPELRDRKDLPVLAAATVGAVDLIVTGDEDLLTLQDFAGIPILNPRAAVAMLGLP